VSLVNIKMKINNIAPFKNVDIEFDKPITVIYGVSGAGKTTVVEMINCLITSLKSIDLAKRCLEERLDIRRRLLGGIGYINLEITSSEGYKASIDVKVYVNDIDLSPKCEGVATCSEIQLPSIIITEDRHHKLSILSKALTDLFSIDMVPKVVELLDTYYRSHAQIDRRMIEPTLNELVTKYKQFLEAKEHIQEYFELYVKRIGRSQELRWLTSSWLKHILNNWIGRNVEYIDIDRLSIDGIPLYLESWGVREIASLIPILVTLSTHNAYEAMGSPNLVVVDSFGMGVTRTEVFLLSTAIARLIKKLYEELENLELILILVTHSDLVLESLILEASGKRSEINEMLRKIGIQQLLPSILEEPKGYISPDDYDIIELVFDKNDRSVKFNKITGIPEYVSKIDIAIFNTIYTKS